MHQIQLDILKRISLKPQARYIDLKNEDVDGNLFMYHLNQLMNDGYIAKGEDKKYHLTESGKQYVSLLSTDSGEMRKQPQILTVIYIEDEKGRLLLFKWCREPNVGLVSLPHGKLHFGTNPKKAALEELKEKCNLEGELTFLGDAYITQWSGKEVFNHLACHVFKASDVFGELKSNTPNGECFWGSLDDLSEAEIWPGTWQIVDAVKENNSTPFLVEIEDVI